MATNTVNNYNKCTAVVRLPAGQSNLTGDGSEYKLVLNNAVVNEGNCFNVVDYSYTIPQTGSYSVWSSITVNDMGVSHTALFYYIYVNNIKTFTTFQCNPANMRPTSSNALVLGSSIIMPFNLNDVLTFYVQVNGVAKTISLTSLSHVGIQKVI